MFVYDREKCLFRWAEQTRRSPLSLFVRLHRGQDTQLRSGERAGLDERLDAGVFTSEKLLRRAVGCPVLGALHFGQEEPPPPPLPLLPQLQSDLSSFWVNTLEKSGRSGTRCSPLLTRQNPEPSQTINVAIHTAALSGQHQREKSRSWEELEGR